MKIRIQTFPLKGGENQCSIVVVLENSCTFLKKKKIVVLITQDLVRRLNIFDTIKDLITSREL